MSPDPVAVVPSAWSLAHHGTPSVLRTLWTTTAGWAVPFDPTHVVTSRTPGLVLLAAPLYRIWPGAGPADQLPASLLAAVITAAAVASLAVLFSKLASRRVALVAALIAAFATTTWTVSGSALWPHGPDQLFLIIAMSGLAAGTAARAGLGFALCMLVRPPLAIVAAVAGLAFSWARRSLRPAITIGLISGLGLLAFVAYADHYWHSGQAGGGALSGATVHGYHGSFFDVSPAAMLDLAEKIGSALVAPNHGILPYSPFLLVLAFGLPAAWRNAPGWVRSSAVGGVLYFVIQMKSEVFDGGTNFWGYRYPLETLTLMAPLLLLAWTHWVSRGLRRRAAFAALVVASVGMQVIGALSFQLPLTTHVWAPADLVTAVVGSPGTITVALAGGIGACVTYLAMTRRTAHQPATV
ncbi:MAG TPA: hypothetical protein VGH43_02530 [Jatrophihabitans sp.]